MAMTDEQEKQLEEFFKTKLREQYNKGLRVGVLTVSKIVIDKLNDSSKTFMKRIKEIKRFCETPWEKQMRDEKEFRNATNNVNSTDDTQVPSEDNIGSNTA